MTTPRLAEVPVLLEGVEGVIFDKDGTLTDLDRRWYPFAESMMRVVLEHLQVDEAHLTSVLTAMGVAEGRLVPDGPFAVGNSAEIRRAAHEALLARGADADAVPDALRQGLAAAVPGPLVPLGAVMGTVRRLTHSGMRVGVATADERQNCERELVELGIAEQVSALRCGSDDGPVKPDGAVLTGICSEWSLPSQQVIYVGDSLGDRTTAVNAGMRFISVRAPDAPERFGADAWVSSIDEMAEFID